MVFQGRQQIQTHQARRLIGLFLRTYRRHLTNYERSIGSVGTMARQVHQIANRMGTNIIAQWRRGIR